MPRLDVHLVVVVVVAFILFPPTDAYRPQVGRLYTIMLMVTMSEEG